MHFQSNPKFTANSVVEMLGSTRYSNGEDFIVHSRLVFNVREANFPG